MADPTTRILTWIGRLGDSPADQKIRLELEQDLQAFRYTTICEKLDQIQAQLAITHKPGLDWKSLVNSLWFRAAVLLSLLAANVGVERSIDLISKLR